MNTQDNENKGNEQGKKRAIITTIIIAIIIIIILLLRSCGTGNSQPSTKEPDYPIGNFEVGDKQETEKPSTTPSGDTPTITFAGYGKYNISKDNSKIELSNPEVNFVSMVFTLTDKDSGTIIARTDKVSPGNYVYVDVSSFYTKAGTYTLLIDTSTYDVETGAQMNGMHQEAEVTVS